MEIIAALLALGASFSWGMDQTLGKIAIKDIDILTFDALRPLFALLFIIPTTLLFSELSWPGLKLFAVAASTGVLAEAIGATIYFYVMKRSAAHKVIPLGNSNPLWAATIAVIFLGEEAKVVIFASVILVVLGVYFLGSRGKSEKSDTWKGGVAIALLAGFLWGLAAPASKYCLNAGMGQMTLQTIRISAAAITCSAILLAYRGKPNLNFGNGGIKIGLISGFLAFFLGFILWLGALSMEPASVVIPFQGAKILFGFLLSIFMIGEKPTKRAHLGAVLIFTGTLLVTIWG